jgi:hypothetical protein
MKKLIAILIFLTNTSAANATVTSQDAAPKLVKNPFLEAKIKIVDPLSLSVDEPLTLNTGIDIDMYNQVSGIAVMPANNPEVTISGRKGANYEVKTGDGFTWDMSVLGGKDNRTMPLGGKDKFKISCAAKSFGEDQDISKSLQQVTVIYDSKK